MSPAVMELMEKAANSVAKVGLVPRGRLDEISTVGDECSMGRSLSQEIIALCR